MTLVVEIVIALSVLTGSIVILIKNIKHLKMFCCSCEQEVSQNHDDDNLKSLEQAIKLLNNIKKNSPRKAQPIAILSSD